MTRKRELLFDLCLALFCLAAAAALAFARAKGTVFLTHATPIDVMTGEARTPFQYRLLVPLLLRFVLTLWPTIKRPYLLFYLADAVFFVAFVACAYALVRRMRLAAVGRAGAIVVCVVLPFVYLVLPPFRPFFNSSDVPSLFFLVACMWMLHAGRWGWFSALFVVGTLNRETTLLALAAFALSAWRERDFRRRAPWLAGCLGAWLSIKVALWVYFAHSPGQGLFEVHHSVEAGGGWHLAANLGYLVDPVKAPWIFFLVLAPLGMALALRPAIAHPLWRAWVDVAAVYVLGLAFIGNFDELRMFADVFVLLALALAGASSGAPSLADG